MAAVLGNHTIAVASTPFESVTTSAISTTGATLLVAVCATAGTAAPLGTFVDNESNTWQGPIIGYGQGGTTTPIQMWYCKNPITSASHTATWSDVGVPAYPSLQFMAWTGTNTTPATADATNSATDNTSPDTTHTWTPSSTQQIVPSQNNDLIICGVGWASSITSPALTGLTQIDLQTWATSSHQGLLVSYFIQSSAAAWVPTFTWGGSASFLRSAYMAIKTIVPAAPTTYKVAGADLNTIFTPFVAGHTPAAATTMQVAGADLNTIFDSIAYGSSAPATTYKVAGADLNTIFAKL